MEKVWRSDRGGLARLEAGATDDAERGGDKKGAAEGRGAFAKPNLDRAWVTWPSWGISCRPFWLSLPCGSPCLGESLGTRASEAKESRACPLQLLYGCQRQESRKFRAENQKMAGVVRKDSPGRHKGRCFLRSAPSCDDGRVGRGCRQDARATRITQLFSESQQVPAAGTSHTISALP